MMNKKTELGYTNVILADKKNNKKLLKLKPKARYSTSEGFIEHDDIALVSSGDLVFTSLGAGYRVFAPTYQDYVMNIKRQAQIIYPKDTAAILMWADIGPHQRIFESGVGQGALSIAILRALAGTGKLTSLEVRKDFAVMSAKFIEDFFGEKPENHEIVIGDAYQPFEGEYDRAVLDLPEPWQVVPHLEKTLVQGGMLVSYIPTILQVKSMVEALKNSGCFDEIETFELILRPWKVDGIAIRPQMWIYNHSAFIVSARKCQQRKDKKIQKTDTNSSEEEKISEDQ